MSLNSRTNFKIQIEVLYQFKTTNQIGKGSLLFFRKCQDYQTLLENLKTPEKPDPMIFVRIEGNCFNSLNVKG